MSEQSTLLEDPFDVDTEEGTKTPELLPPGKYSAEIEDAHVTNTKNGAGQMVSFRWRIVEGEYENRVLFDHVLIQHTSADAQKFGRQKFRDICFACGITGKVTDLDTLKYKKCRIGVGVQKDRDGQYADKNRVGRVDPYIAPWNGSRPAAKPASPKPASKAGPDDGFPDDDIPF
jgi:Protein of unknown function (DUF669)